MLVIGIDDAGRGPLIGPMALAGVILTKKQEELLKDEGVRDSKLVIQEKRVALASLIHKNSIGNKTLLIEPLDIDSLISSGTNLNTIEAMKIAAIINHLMVIVKEQKARVVVDCPSPNLFAWKNTLMKYLECKEVEIACEHKADFNHVSVGAASILAKVAREEAIATIRAQYGDIGSGYASDPITKRFLLEHGATLADSGLFRKSWATWKRMFPTQGQTTLQGF